MAATEYSYQANIASLMGGYDRRRDDWKLQEELAEIDIEQIDKQILAGEIRLAIAEKEKENQQRQIERSREVYNFMRRKFTNEQLYQWMIGQLSGLHYQAYSLAFDMAQKAQEAAKRELGKSDMDYIRFGHWDNLKKGLLAGERLNQQLRRLDAAYMEQNSRRYELTKSISLGLLNPEELFALRDGNPCQFTLPKWLFDMDFPHHSNRRIKNVRLTIPAVVGPYTTLAAELSLVETGEAICSSSGQNDAGLFELNMRDERFLPFEGETLDNSTWRLEIPGEIQFDSTTISDVILHVSYTAIQGTAEPSRPPEDDREGIWGITSIRTMFSSAWAAFQRNTDVPPITFTLGQEHLPYAARAWLQANSNAAESIIFIELNQPNETGNRLVRRDEWLNRPTSGVLGVWSINTREPSELSTVRDIYILIRFPR